MRKLILTLILTLFVSSAFAQDVVMEESAVNNFTVAPETYEPKCSDYGTYYQVEVNPLRSGTRTYTGQLNQSIQVTKDSDTQFDWKASYPVERIIILSAHNTSKIYTYSPISFGADDLRSYYWAGYGYKDIEKIRFCYKPIPTSAEVSVYGTVTDEYGRAIRGAVVTILKGSDGSEKYSVTNSFGKYNFNGIASGEFYQLSVNNKRYQFRAYYFSLVDDLEVNFQAFSNTSDSK